MGSFVLSCESTADYPRSFFEARGIEYIMFHYELDGVVHEDDLYQSVTPEAFFGALKAGSTSKTSQVSVGEYTEFWKPMLEAGKDVLHLTLSSGISGTYNSRSLRRATLRPSIPIERCAWSIRLPHRRATVCSWITLPTCAMPGQRSTRRLRGPKSISLTSTIGSSSLTSIA